MANQEHLDILKQGVDGWNLWRKEHTDRVPDLSEANLRGAALSEANLIQTNLSGADLSSSNLNGADLSEANLIHTDLSNADLSNANLQETNLRGAHLISANLHKADLSHSDLKSAILGGANLSEAHLRETDLRETDLSQADFFLADLSRAELDNANLSEASFTHANLSKAYLIDADLSRADLRGANLHDANLHDANLTSAILLYADLSKTNLIHADLSRADLRGAKLIHANLSEANLIHTVLNEADLSDANLTRATLVDTNFTEAILTNCNIYGIAAWNVELEGARQNNLVITPEDELTITVDNLKIAQFIYLLLNNVEIREVIDTITSKVVLILGRFTPERKTILDTLRDALRQHGYLPILFDFEKPASRDITETVSTLAHLARFVIADITDAKSIPQELMIIVPHLPSVPVQPLILTSQHEYGMFEHFTRFPWVLPVYQYIDEASLLQSLQEKVIAPAEQKAQELQKP